MRINKEFCISCGGLRSYVGDSPTAGAPNYPGQRIEVYPTPLNITSTATYVPEDRVCGCRVKPNAY